jgi:hypothetical protein
LRHRSGRFFFQRRKFSWGVKRWIPLVSVQCELTFDRIEAIGWRAGDSQLVLQMEDKWLVSECKSPKIEGLWVQVLKSECKGYRLRHSGIRWLPVHISIDAFNCTLNCVDCAPAALVRYLLNTN